MFTDYLKRWYEALLSIFFARRCAGCAQIAETGLFCEECRASIIQPLWLPAGEALDGTVMLLRYSGPVRTALQQLKFNSRRALLELLAVECAAAGKGLPSKFKNVLQQTDVFIVPIPTAENRRLERGFDIPQFLFSWLKAEYVWIELLLRTRETIPQYGLGPQERKINLENCFSIGETVTGKTIVIVDDIFTTGATMEEAARTLKTAGAAKVYGLAMCGSIENYGQEQIKKHLQSEI